MFNSIVYPAMPITSRLRLPAPTVFNIVFRFYPSYVKSQNMTYKHAITLQIKFSHTGTLANFFKSENDFFINIVGTEAAGQVRLRPNKVGFGSTTMVFIMLRTEQSCEAGAGA